jgi:DNA-binding MarR family transcriptional regulator
MRESQLPRELHELERYVHDALGVSVKPTPWSGAERLPHFLKERYRFAQAALLGLHALLVIDTNSEEQSPATVRKHMDMLQTKQHADLIYVRAQMTAYNRKRLIEQKVPFIVPGNQMYLPMLAIDLREHFRRIHEELPTFSPSTQVVVLYALLRDAGQVLIPTEMAPLLGYSAMTMTRAFDELETASLAEVTVRGRQRCLRFNGERREIWEKAQTFLRSPVNKRLFIRRIEGAEGAIRAGLTALAHCSMLAAPAYTAYALSREDWKTLRERHKITEVPAQDPDASEIEVWWYPPALFAEGDIVDPLSLYLSLKADHDERTETALEEMMEKFKW